jgi:hypothetical protein
MWSVLQWLPADTSREPRKSQQYTDYFRIKRIIQPSLKRVSETATLNNTYISDTRIFLSGKVERVGCLSYSESETLFLQTSPWYPHHSVKAVL